MDPNPSTCMYYRLLTLVNYTSLKKLTIPFLQNLVKKTFQKYGRIDCVINNAGYRKYIINKDSSMVPVCNIPYTEIWRNKKEKMMTKE